MCVGPINDFQSDVDGPPQYCQPHALFTMTKPYRLLPSFHLKWLHITPKILPTYEVIYWRDTKRSSSWSLQSQSDVNYPPVLPSLLGTTLVRALDLNSSAVVPTSVDNTCQTVYFKASVLKWRHLSSGSANSCSLCWTAVDKRVVLWVEEFLTNGLEEVRNSDLNHLESHSDRSLSPLLFLIFIKDLANGKNSNVRLLWRWLSDLQGNKFRNGQK